MSGRRTTLIVLAWNRWDLTRRCLETLSATDLADAEVFRLEAIVRWLDAADVRLKQLPSHESAREADVPVEPTRTTEVSR